MHASATVHKEPSPEDTLARSQVARESGMGADTTKHKAGPLSEDLERQKAQNPVPKEEQPAASPKGGHHPHSLYETGREKMHKAYERVADAGHKVAEMVTGHGHGHEHKHGHGTMTAAEPAGEPRDEHERPEAKAGGFKLGQEQQAQRSAEVENAELAEVKEKSKQAALYSA